MGLLKCPDCGQTLLVHTDGHNPSREAADKTCYECMAYRKKGVDFCTAHRIGARGVENAVKADIDRHTAKAMKDKGKFINNVLRSMNENSAKRSKKIMAEIGKLRLLSGYKHLRHGKGESVMKYAFRSGFAADIEKMLIFKESLGHRSDSYVEDLRQFDRFCAESCRRWKMKKNNDAFWTHLRLYFSVYIPKQRNSSPHTVAAYRDTWNLLMLYLAVEKGMNMADIGMGDITPAAVTGFLDHMAETKGWTPSMSFTIKIMTFSARIRRSLYGKMMRIS